MMSTTHCNNCEIACTKICPKPRPFVGVDDYDFTSWFSFLAESSSTTEEAITATEEQPQTCLPDNEITPARMCKSIFNTTAPMYGVSLTSGEPVTIVQIFPDLLQQVVFEMCE